MKKKMKMKKYKEFLPESFGNELDVNVVQSFKKFLFWKRSQRRDPEKRHHNVEDVVSGLLNRKSRRVASDAEGEIVSTEEGHNGTECKMYIQFIRKVYENTFQLY